ncbi:hypothetical protein [Actinoplanes sp. NPDC051859]|uniref:hypothetical protein n=1 Tax=Actinoplanes sp. NPDC051859 TaxID=3363909 RepID=UPI00379389CB
MSDLRIDDPPAAAEQVHRLVGGTVVVLCAVAAAWAATIAGHTTYGDRTSIGWDYSPMTWGLLLALSARAR